MQPKTQPLSDEVDDHRPPNFAVAVPAHDRHRRAKQSQLIQQCRSTDIAQMPNLVRLFSQSGKVCRRAIVGVGEDENAHC